MIGPRCGKMPRAYLQCGLIEVRKNSVSVDSLGKRVCEPTYVLE